MRTAHCLIVIGILAALPLLRADRPQIHATPKDKPAILAKIKDEPWAAEAWTRLLADIDPIVERVQKQPDWLLSRMSMYWKPGERYTQCYIKDQNWDRGEGNAPVPTVRLPGMRIWNDYKNVPLEQRIPYNETGDMLAFSRKTPSAPTTLVPYKQSGHLIRDNNREILDLAAKSAFAHWLTGEPKYADLATDVYWTWLLGTYHMQPPLDPKQSTGGPGAYAPGGMMGYYDYEQIHDDLLMHGAVIYDFLRDHLAAHPPPLPPGKDLDAISAEVFKRFIEIGFVRGQKTGNWNINGWAIMMPGILALGPDSAYADGKGRAYYLKHYTTISTSWHDALPDILKTYDPITGLWPESPGYALGTINTLLDLSHPLSLTGADTIGGNPMMQKAALAIFPWLDARGNLVVFGDTRGGPGSFLAFERLLTHYRKTGDTANTARISAAIRQGIDSGQYDRAAASGWKGLCANVPLSPPTTESVPYARAAWSATHRHLILKNGNDPDTALMLTLYGGGKANHHLRPNGLALQLYGRGYALAPDASAFESYWNDDVHYHQGATGSNTILPGYTQGPVTINALDPAPAPDAFTADYGVSPSISFADISATEKRRVAAIIRTSPTTGYYVDIFRSRQPDNDYLYHNLGDKLAIFDATGHPLTTTALDAIPAAPDKAYSYFKNVRRSALVGGDWSARWTLANAKPALEMTFWMQSEGEDDSVRELYQVDAPPTTLLPALTPGGASLAPNPTPTIIVRQNGRDGWATPFVAVAEPHDAGQRSITAIRGLPATETLAGVIVESVGLNARRDLIIVTTDDAEHIPAPDLSVRMRGAFAVVTTDASGLRELYLGVGRLLVHGGWKIEADTPVSISLRATDAGFVCSATGPVSITRPDGRTMSIPAGQDQK